jgi:hypothetical protein
MHGTDILLSKTCLLPLLLALASPALADLIELNDGRSYEGQVVEEANGKVRVDVMLGRTRAAFDIPRVDIKSIVPKPLAPGFFDPPPAPPRAANAAKVKATDNSYLEVPIVGDVGLDVSADAIANILRYANTHGVRHLVFVVDSAGGDLDEAVEIYDLLRLARGKPVGHVIVRRCIGPALAVAFWAKDLRFLSGARLGVLPRAAEGEVDSELALSRAQLAYKVVSETGKKGLGAEILRAIVDPDATLCVWRGDDGKPAFDAVCPSGVAAADVIIKVSPGATLELTEAHARALGMPEFSGGAAELGAHLGLKGWVAESDYGVRTMTRIALEKRKAATAKQAAHDAKVTKNMSRRATTNDYVSHCLQEAAAWDPTKGSYALYATYYDWGWGWGADTSGKKYTLESQKKWKTRTDACSYYLASAVKGLKQMRTLDKEAVKLGLDPTYPAGEIEKLLMDLGVRLRTLAQHRDTTGE